MYGDEFRTVDGSLLSRTSHALDWEEEEVEFCWPSVGSLLELRSSAALCLLACQRLILTVPCCLDLQHARASLQGPGRKGREGRREEANCQPQLKRSREVKGGQRSLMDVRLQGKLVVYEIIPVHKYQST